MHTAKLRAFLEHAAAMEDATAGAGLVSSAAIRAADRARDLFPGGVSDLRRRIAGSSLARAPLTHWADRIRVALGLGALHCRADGSSSAGTNAPSKGDDEKMKMQMKMKIKTRQAHEVAAAQARVLADKGAARWQAEHGRRVQTPAGNAIIALPQASMTSALRGHLLPLDWSWIQSADPTRKHIWVDVPKELVGTRIKRNSLSQLGVENAPVAPNDVAAAHPTGPRHTYRSGGQFVQQPGDFRDRGD